MTGRHTLTSPPSTTNLTPSIVTLAFGQIMYQKPVGPVNNLTHFCYIGRDDNFSCSGSSRLENIQLFIRREARM